MTWHRATRSPLTRRLSPAVVVALLAVAGCATVPAAPEVSTGVHGRLDPRLQELLPEFVRERGVLLVGTDASYPPMSSFAADGRTVTGVEPELGAELGRVLGVEVRFVIRPFTRLLPAVAAGRIDLAMSAMTDTRERERQVDFVNYFTAGTAILVRRGNPQGVTDLRHLCGHRVAVETGTTQVDLLERAQHHCAAPMEVTEHETNADALLQLRTGRAVAVLNDMPPAALLASDPRTSSHYQLASTAQLEPGLYGIAVAKRRTGLRDAVRGALEQLVKNGVYAGVLQRAGLEEGAVGQVTVNSGS